MTTPSHIGTEEKLVRMANQIAGFFATQPKASQAEETAAHIRAFWDPRMRAQLSKLLATDANGLSPLARAAAEHLEQSEQV
ncbi:formate dehydrogenase subunit delta [Flavimaricola marinus]|uniref:NADH-dependent formate dehydrogenase delta subunit FdsD n=1 Tax=Flavimaricola marinus TaxID=1819565 RepID=A0A238LB53_9RHOB|nr:formate dehydrogenase subunit delta [Flavimaricola marinus]SMY06655.1 NADH-dependent formate dehydrogenase delta subunit FdsD [Flavimaricola marinus]